MDQELYNPGWEDKFTCPACYHDHLDRAPGQIACENCGVSLTCTVEHQPVAVCSLTKTDE